MTDFPQDDARLSATEAQMRRALGLGTASSPRPRPVPPTLSSNGSHRPPRHFVKDGEVPVTVIHRDESSGTNQFEVARQTIRSLTAARDQAERLLSEAQATIQQLQTQLAHERQANDGAAQRAEAEKQVGAPPRGGATPSGHRDDFTGARVAQGSWERQSEEQRSRR